MKGGRGWAAGMVLLAVSARAVAPAAGDGGGRDVTVALFSTRMVRSVTVTPIGAQAWVSSCAQCAHRALTEPLHVAGRVEVFAGGALRVTDDATGEKREGAGLWHLRGNGVGNEVDVVLTLPSERYVAAVLNAEAAAGEPAESLRALAIVARTYGLNGGHYAARAGHLEAELCDSTECQTILLGDVPEAVRDAVRARLCGLAGGGRRCSLARAVAG